MTAKALPNHDQIEQLYCEALILADELASAFSEPQQTVLLSLAQADESLAMACHRLRTAVFIRDATGWLRCRRSGSREFKTSLQKNFKRSELSELCRLPPAVHQLVAQTEELFAKVLELDDAWYDQRDYAPSNVVYMDAWRSKTGSGAR